MKEFSFCCSKNMVGFRLDQFLAQQLPQFSRTRIQAIIAQGLVSVNQKEETKPSRSLALNDTIILTLPEKTPRTIPDHEEAQNFFLETKVLEHKDFIIINKPAGLVTHPPAKNSKETALSDLLHAAYPFTQEIGEEGREGIVHRLDKDTSGLIILAKTIHGYQQLRAQFCNRTINKAYIALVSGHTDPSGNIPVPIMRDPLDPKKMMASYTGNGLEASTKFKTHAYGIQCSLVEAQPKTGRTHQVRVHFCHIGHPLLGDTLYGKSHLHMKRHALHAYRLWFSWNNEPIEVYCPLPKDMRLCAETQNIPPHIITHFCSK